ncbi:unnamed protein product [Amoebophrya sp. A120]|nr:unnamed protein product [Amoebophrya sp. A120]|eukprot:GSA120T00011759001.1
MYLCRLSVRYLFFGVFIRKNFVSALHVLRNVGKKNWGTRQRLQQRVSVARENDHAVAKEQQTPGSVTLTAKFAVSTASNPNQEKNADPAYAVFLDALRSTWFPLPNSASSGTTALHEKSRADPKCGPPADDVQFPSSADVQWVCDLMTQNNSSYLGHLHYKRLGPTEASDYVGDPPARSELNVTHNFVFCKNDDVDVQSCTVNQYCQPCMNAIDRCYDKVNRMIITVDCETA